MGYLAGVDDAVVRRFVNAAFNSGNSGGPLFLCETNDVIGTVSAKLVPFSPLAVKALKALHDEEGGPIYELQVLMGR